MDKSWVWLPWTSLEYEQGATDFVYGAAKRLGDPPNMFCPCLDCQNLCHQPVATVLDHLVIRGMDQKYKRNRCWSNHGEIRDLKTVDGQTSEFEAYELFRATFCDGGRNLQPESDKAAAAVVVTFAADKEAYVWRPTATVTSLGEAVGTKIAWPFSKLILDTMNTQTVNKSACSAAANALEDRIQIISWTNDGEVIVEGYLISTDPKEMVNNITLGPNAATVKIDNVINKDACLPVETK